MADSTHHRSLISGAGIAGMGLAHWLARSGHSVVLIDKFRAFSPAGHFMTLKGTCVDLLKDLGVYAELKTHEWPPRTGTYTSTGRFLRRATKTKIEEMLGGFLTVRRAHLHKVLHDHLPSSVEFRAGTEIAGVADRGGQIEVGFQGGSNERFDLLAGADGVRSRTRQLCFPEVTTRRMHGHYIVFIVECRHELGGHTPTVWGEGQSVSLIPLGPTRLDAMIYLDDRNPTPPSTMAPLEWRSYFSTLFQAYPAWVRDCVQALQPGDEVFADEILMVPARRLARGGVALVGDAGYCPTFFSGMGAAALLGAYVLTRQLDRHDNVRTALIAYEAAVLPVARGYQRSAFESRRRTLARGVMAGLRNFAAAHIPEKLGEIASRRNYQSEVTMQSLGD